jgi:phosphatidyl-myo-inositol alpha-mannosyltransferase
VRVGLFQTATPEPDRKPGGVEVVVDRLARKLAERGHRVTVFSFSSPPGGAPFKYVRLSPSWAGRNKVAQLLAVPLLLNRLDTSSLDVLHLHGDDWFFLRRKLPTVRTVHGSALFEARYASSWRRRLSQLVVFPLELAACRLATAAYSVAPGMPRGYQLEGELLPGIDIPEYSVTIREAPPAILFVGTWHGRKRGYLLKEIFERYVQPRVPDAELWLVSDAASAANRGVRWFPRPSDAELEKLYRTAWVLCLPSAYEGFGLPYIEAMSYGTPVVATSNPGSRFTSDNGRAAWLVADEFLGRAIVELLTKPSLRARLAEAGRSRAQTFSWESVVVQHEEAYRLAIARWDSRN